MAGAGGGVQAGSWAASDGAQPRVAGGAAKTRARSGSGEQAGDAVASAGWVGVGGSGEPVTVGGGVVWLWVAADQCRPVIGFGANAKRAHGAMARAQNEWAANSQGRGPNAVNHPGLERILAHTETSVRLSPMWVITPGHFPSHRHGERPRR